MSIEKFRIAEMQYNEPVGCRVRIKYEETYIADVQFTWNGYDEHVHVYDAVLASKAVEIVKAIEKRKHMEPFEHYDLSVQDSALIVFAKVLFEQAKLEKMHTKVWNSLKMNMKSSALLIHATHDIYYVIAQYNGGVFKKFEGRKEFVYGDCFDIKSGVSPEEKAKKLLSKASDNGKNKLCGRIVFDTNSQQDFRWSLEDLIDFYKYL